MKKNMIIAILSLATLLSACGNKPFKGEIDPDFKPDFKEVEGVVTGDDKTVETYEITNMELAEKIKKINRLAVVEESMNPGFRMLKIDLPIIEEPDDKAEEFFEEVEEIVLKCKLEDTTDYDFYYFSTSKDDVVEITAAFKRIDGKLILESVNGISEMYKNAPDIAAEESALFR